MKDYKTITKFTICWIKNFTIKKKNKKIYQ